MGKVGCAVVYRPFFHAAGNLACDILAKRGAFGGSFFVLFVCFAGKVFFHGFIAKHHTAKLFRKFHFYLLIFVLPQLIKNKYFR